MLPLVRPQLGTWPATQAWALTRNRTDDLLVHRLALNPLSHTIQGRSWSWCTSWSLPYTPVIDTSEAATNCESLCSSKQVAHIWSPATKTIPRSPKTNIPGGGIQTTSEHNPIRFISGTPKGRSWQAPDPAGSNSASWDKSLHSPCTVVGGRSL